jgi:hypothetical protein
VPSLEDLHSEQNRSMDALISSFEDHLRTIVARAQGRVFGQLQKRLGITDGVIDRTAANNRILRTLDAVFVREMDAAGYQSLVRAFVGEFPGQLGYLNETLRQISEGMKEPLPIYKLSTADSNVLASLQANVSTSLEMVMEGVAGAAIQNVLLSVGGLKFGELVQVLSEKLNIAVGRAKSVADTGISTWFRTATDRAFQAIENDLPSKTIKYKYTSGPDDSRTRIFCHRMIVQTRAGKSWTRDQINEMSNGQLPNVLLTAGGFNCRHAWLMSVA